MIETLRLRLRRPEARDAGAIEHLFTDPIVMRYYQHVARAGAGVAWLGAIIRTSGADGFAPWTVELRDGTFVGVCGPLSQEIEGKHEVEVICFFERRFWRTHYSDEAGRASIAAVFERVDVQRIIGLVFPQNRPSIRLMLRLGYTFERNVLIMNGQTMALYALDRAVFLGAQAPRLTSLTH